MTVALTRVSASIRPTAKGDVTRWGPWRLAAAHPALEHATRVYEVSLLECRTAAQCLDSIVQVARKTWADPATVAGLVHALDDVLNLQSGVCPGGTARHLDRRQVRVRARAAAAWAPLCHRAAGSTGQADR